MIRVKLLTWINCIVIYFVTSFGFCDKFGQLDTYSALIVGFYLKDTKDVLHLMQVNSKFGKEQILSKKQQKLIKASEILKQYFEDQGNEEIKELLEIAMENESTVMVEDDYGKLAKMYHVNPIPLTLENYSLFPKIETQCIFDIDDFIVDGLECYVIKAVPFEAYKYFKQRFKHLKQKGDRPALCFEEVIVAPDRKVLGYYNLFLQQINQLKADDSVKAITFSEDFLPTQQCNTSKKMFVYFKIPNEPQFNEDGVDTDIFCTLLHVKSAFRHTKCRNFYGINLRTIDENSFVLSDFQEAYLPALVDLIGLKSASRDAMVRHFKKIWVSRILLDKIIDSDILLSCYKVKFRAYNVKQEKAIADKLKELQSLSSRAIYQKSLIDVMQGKTTPRQEEVIQSAWQAFEKAQCEYKQLLLQNDTTVEFQQVVQDKKEEIATLKAMLMENISGQF